MGELLRFPPRSDIERESLIAQACANYDSIFPATTDGGKARILRRRDNFKFRTSESPKRDVADDLAMDHADNGIPSDSPYHAPDHDGA